MVGYSEGNKAYRVYDESKIKLMIRRDVIFNETATWEEQEVDESIQKIEEPRNADEDGEAEETPKKKRTIRGYQFRGHQKD